MEKQKALSDFQIIFQIIFASFVPDLTVYRPKTRQVGDRCGLLQPARNSAQQQVQAVSATMMLRGRVLNKSSVAILILTQTDT